MGFRFTLSAVLRFRESVENREELALQKIQMEIARVEQQIEALTAEIARKHALRERTMQQPVPAIQLHSIVSDVNTAGEKRKSLFTHLRTLEQHRAEQMKRYQAAHQERQMLSEMLDRQRDAYELERTRTEQKFLDDIFASRSQRS